MYAQHQDHQPYAQDTQQHEYQPHHDQYEQPKSEYDYGYQQQPPMQQPHPQPQGAYDYGYHQQPAAYGYPGESVTSPSEYGYAPSRPAASEYGYASTAAGGVGTYSHSGGSTYHARTATPLGAKSAAGYSTSTAMKPVDDDDVYKTGSGSPRFCCGCFGTRRSCLGTCCSLFLFLLAGLAVAGFFLFPRKPDIFISGPYVPTSTVGFVPVGSWTPGLVTSGNLATASAATPFVLAIGLGVNVSVYSPNYVGYHLDSLTVSGELKDTSGNIIGDSPNTKLSLTSAVDNFSVAPRTNTDIKLPVSVNYTITTTSVANILQDPVFATLIAACGIPGQPKTSAGINMHIIATIELRILKWTGWKPSVIRDPSFACPADFSNQLASVLSAGAGAGGGGGSNGA